MMSVDERETQGPPQDPPDAAGPMEPPHASDRTRSIEHVKRAMAIVRRVIAWNRRMDPGSPHAGRAEQRVIDGEIELALLEAELNALEAEDAHAGHVPRDESGRRGR